MRDVAWRHFLDIEGSVDYPIVVESTQSNGLDFIEDNMLKLVQAFFDVKTTQDIPGDSTSIKTRITLRDFDWVDWNENFDNDKVDDLTKDDTLGEKTSYSLNSNKIVRQNNWNFYKRNKSGSFLNDITYTNQLVESTHGEVGINVQLDHEGLPQNINTDTTNNSFHFDTLKQLNYRFFKNYDPPIEIDVETDIKKVGLETFDRVSYSNDTMPALNLVTWDNVHSAIIFQSFNFRNASFVNRLITFSQLSKVLNGTVYTINKVDSGSITKPTMVLHPVINAPNDFSEDGFYDNTVSAYRGHLFIISIQITEPGQPLDPSVYRVQEVGLQISTVRNGAFECIDKRQSIKYDYVNSATRVIKLNLWSTSNSAEEGTARLLPDRVKVEWFYASAADTLKHPSIKFVGVDFVRFSFDY